VHAGAFLFHFISSSPSFIPAVGHRVGPDQAQGHVLIQVASTGMVQLTRPHPRGTLEELR